MLGRGTLLCSRCFGRRAPIIGGKLRYDRLLRGRPPTLLEMEISLWAGTPFFNDIFLALVVFGFVIVTFTFHARVPPRRPGAFWLRRAGNRGLCRLLGRFPQTGVVFLYIVENIQGHIGVPLWVTIQGTGPGRAIVQELPLLRRNEEQAPRKWLGATRLAQVSWQRRARARSGIGRLRHHDQL